MTNVHPLDDVRGLQEEHKSPWPTIVREHLNRTLVRTGYVSAEDFDALGIPAEHSNLANAQMGAYSRMGYMEAISWHRSKKPSRKSGKVWTHKITEKGRQELSKLVGVGIENPEGITPGATGALDRPTTPSGEGAGSSLDADPGESYPLQLDIPESPRLFDYDRPEAA